MNQNQNPKITILTLKPHEVNLSDIESLHIESVASFTPDGNLRKLAKECTVLVGGQGELILDVTLSELKSLLRTLRYHYGRNIKVTRDVKFYEKTFKADTHQPASLRRTRKVRAVNWLYTVSAPPDAVADSPDTPTP